MSDGVLIGAVLMAVGVVDFGVGTFIIIPRIPEERRQAAQIAFFGAALLLVGVGGMMMGGVIRV